MFTEFINSLKRPENESLIEAIQKGYKACFENISEYQDKRYQILRKVITDIIHAKEGERQPWASIPLEQIKPLWEDYIKYGFVRNQNAIERLASNIINKIATIHANTYLMEHTTEDPRAEIEEVLSEMDANDRIIYEEFQDKLVDYVVDENGDWRISDYGMDKLEELAVKMTDVTGEELLLLIDQVLNVVHVRSNLARMFVEGGRNALDELAGNKKAIAESISKLNNVTFEIGKEPTYGKWKQITPFINNEPVGRLIFGKNPYNKNGISIEQVDVDEDFRRQGIASKMIDKLRELYPNKQISGIPKNAASEGLFNKMNVENELDQL